MSDAIAVQTRRDDAFSPVDILHDKHILLIGTTGFLAKVMLALLLERFAVKKVSVLVRPQRSKSARERFFTEVMDSEMMEPLRRKFGPSFSAYVDEKVEVVAGDISQPGLGIDDDTANRLVHSLDVVVNSAGLVNFNPPLDDALDVNATGALHVAQFAARCDRPNVVHISTCFVAGNRSGWIREDEPVVGYFPAHKTKGGIAFDHARELSDLAREIREVKGKTDDATLEGRFWEEAEQRLKDEGKRASDRTLRAAATHARRRWVADELVRRGIARANYWGWPNIYTYTKALGEQAITSTPGVNWAIVRPSIVESALEYPFAGWNEGMNTSAPLAYVGLRGHVIYPVGEDLILDVIPVDYVASATLAITAALLAGDRGRVYQVATGDVNPCTVDRVLTLLGLARRRRVNKDAEANAMPSWRAAIERRRQALPLPRSRYERFSAPMLKKLVGRAKDVLSRMEPEKFGPLGEVIFEAKRTAEDVETKLGKIVDLFDLFLPFIEENKYVFRTVHTRALFDRMNEADRALLPYHPEKIDWRHFWLDIHIPGLEKWVFPKLEETGPKRIPIPKSYRDLAELFESKTEEHARRVAYRILNEGSVAEDFTYKDVRRAAGAAATFLHAHGVEKKDRVVLASESRPEWGMSYFGVILAGATVVPVDPDSSAEEITRLARASRARAIIASETVRKKLADVALDAPVYSFDAVFEHANEDCDVRALARMSGRAAEDLASIIFTSGTTGSPKGVMLTDRNFTALTARIAALFRLQRNDSIVSVLPLHHTFEFSAGFLMPFLAGASVTYLEERTPELLSRAFRETPVTAMVGVPAVWESLHRKVMRGLKDKGAIVEWTMRRLIDANRWLRDKTPWNVGRWVFRPAHQALGGRVRWMVSGGAALSPKIYQDLRGLGFSIYEGYGLTEASPVVSVGWPGERTPVGSVGWPLPGVEVRIDAPNDAGVGEVLARGPTMMAGYLDDPNASKLALREGWLHTGDLGRLDERGHLFIVGREKDVVIDTSGKNVYPDEIEELYGTSPLIKEMSVVGIPAEEGTGERVAALVVPNYEAEVVDRERLTKEDVRERIREHFRDVGSRQPFARRVKLMHFWENDLPRTATKKVKRPFVQDQIVRLERTTKAGRGTEAPRSDASRAELLVFRTIASVCQRTPDAIRKDTRLVDGLGFDSMMQLELLSALEAEFPLAKVSQEDIGQANTVGDIIRLVLRDQSAQPEIPSEHVGTKDEAPPLHVPTIVQKIGKAALGWAQRESYTRYFDISVTGLSLVPENVPFIVAANHSSHLDMGLIKHALAGRGGDLATLAAKDYFFDDPVRRTYFENFTNLLPMDRHGSLKKSLRLASEAIRGGSSLLIFPEGTRSRDGAMGSFKATVGFLALHGKVPVVPAFLEGTHEALPVGGAVPKRHPLCVKFGVPLTPDVLESLTRNLPRAAAYRLAAEEIERRVRALGGLLMPARAGGDSPSTGDATDARELGLKAEET